VTGCSGLIVAGLTSASIGRSEMEIRLLKPLPSRLRALQDAC
jgi:hypothetical protein